MQIFLSLLALLATLIFAYSLFSVLYPLKPFRSRSQAFKGVGGSFVAVLALVTFVGLIDNPKAAPASGTIAEAKKTEQQALADDALSVATVAPSLVPAACGDGGLALMDEVTVNGSHELYAAPEGGRIINEKATAALGETHYQQIDYSQRLRRTCAHDVVCRFARELESS